MGRRPRDLMDPASMNPEQLTSTPTKQDFLNEEIQKVGDEDTSRGPTTRRHSRFLERMKFVPPIFKCENKCFVGKMILAKFRRPVVDGFLVTTSGQTDVWELFSHNSCFSAILDRQGLLVAAPVDLSTKKAESFSPQALQGFWSKIKMKNPKIVVMLPTVFTKYTNQKEVIWQQQPPSVLGSSRTSNSRR